MFRLRVCLCYACAWCLGKPEGSIDVLIGLMLQKSSGHRVLNWESNPDSLEEKPGLLTASNLSTLYLLVFDTGHT